MSVARDFIDYPYFANLGALQLAAALDQHGLETLILDAFSTTGAGIAEDDERILLGLDGESLLGSLDAERYAAITNVVVAYTPFHRPPTRDSALAPLLSGLRRLLPDALLILADCYQSGQHYVEVAASQVHDSYPEIDVLVRYEAEKTLPQLLAKWRDRRERPPAVVDGQPADLATLPPPAWHRVDLEAYDRFRNAVTRQFGPARWVFPIDGRTLPLITSRGCPFSCTHCSSNPDTVIGRPKSQRRLSAVRLRDQLESLAALGVSRLAVLDEMLNINRQHFDGFLDLVEELDLRFELPNGMRADCLEKRDLERLARRITTLSVSAESGSQRVVDEVVGKRLDLDKVVVVAAQCHEIGLPLLIHFMIGLPGETAEEINETLEFAFHLWDCYQAWPALQYATPLPGTRLAQLMDAKPVVDWGPLFQKAPSQRATVRSSSSRVEPARLERFMWAFTQRLEASRGPRKLIMNVTYVCNNRCTFCAVGTRTQVDGPPRRQLEHLRRYRQEGVELVDFDGGEPTMNPHLIDLVGASRKLGYRGINVTTNGRLCAYDDFAKRLVNSGLTTLLFSIHGADARTHARNVGVPEAFEQTIAGVSNCRRLAPAGVELGMNVTITNLNADQLDELAELAWKLGLPWLNLQFLTPFGRATRSVAPDMDLATRNTMAVIDRWQDRMKIQVINLPFCQLPGYERFVLGDVAKLERHMVFVNNETVNLGAYLAQRRVHKPVCETCPYACFCGGFYELDDVPEPPWLVHPDDPGRQVAPAPLEQRSPLLPNRQPSAAGLLNKSPSAQPE